MWLKISEQSVSVANTRCFPEPDARTLINVYRHVTNHTLLRRGTCDFCGCLQTCPRELILPGSVGHQQLRRNIHLSSRVRKYRFLRSCWCPTLPTAFRTGSVVHQLLRRNIHLPSRVSKYRFLRSCGSCILSTILGVRRSGHLITSWVHCQEF